MNRSLRLFLILGLVAIVGFAGVSLLSRPKPALGATRTLSRPTFAQSTLPVSPSGGNIIEDEAGIAAYFESSSTIDLDDIRDEFRSIEQETDQYILGTIPLPDYDETMDIHIFAHVDGSVLAYYRNTDPTAKAVDLVHWDVTGTINTNLETALDTIAGAALIELPSIDFYHFGYPNATHMTVVAEQDDGDNNDSFQIELTSSYGYFERSVSAGERSNWDGVVFDIEDEQLLSCGNGGFCYAEIAPSDLPLDTLVTAEVNGGDYSYSDVVALVLVYQIP